jgi:hypothetical protein
LLKRGIVQNEETQPVQTENGQSNRYNQQPETKLHSYKTGSMWIDPKTHHVVLQASENIPTQSKAIYAVGAMTRGQIIDASMAHGIVQSTARIASYWVDDLKQVAG